MIEMLVSIAIAGMMMTGIAGVFIAQVKQHQVHLSRRGVQSGGRQAVAFMDRNLRKAGYGVDPAMTFLAYDGFDVSNPATRDDRYPDAITAHIRDPLFQRTATAASTSSITVSVALTEGIKKGQILLALCSGALNYSYVTVNSAVPAGQTTIPLETAVAGAESPISSPGARFHQQAALSQDCYDTATIVKIDRLSFYVAAFDDDGLAGTPRTPYLMLHRGTDLTEDGSVSASDAVPFTPGVEQLQISYALHTSTTTPALVGVTSASTPGWGDAWATSIAVPADLSGAWYWTDSYSAANRSISHPANIRQIRVTMIVRGSDADRDALGDELYNPTASWAQETLTTSGVVAWRQLENLNATPATNFDPRGLDPANMSRRDGFLRRVVRFSVAPKNLLMRTQILPPNPGQGG